MSSKPRFVRFVRKLLVSFAVLLAVVSVKADGPDSLVNGVTKTDSEGSGGNGQSWGRTGGRTWTFTVGDTSQYATLHWGATQPPQAAFDDNVNASGEVMTFDPASTLNAGVARWTGDAVLALQNGFSAGVPTRFTLTVTGPGNVAVPLSNSAGGAVPGVNVKSAGTFTANLLFEAQHTSAFGGTGQWEPILEFYDNQPTAPGNLPASNDGPVQTSFFSGFYSTLANTGMTVDEHDLNEIARFTALTSTANQIKDGTEFLRIEVPGRLGPIQTDVTQIKNNVMAVQQLLQSLPSGVQIPTDLARQSDVQAAKDNITQILMILLGMEPCPLSPAQCASLTFMPQVARQTNLLEVQQAINALPTQANVAQVQLALAGLASQISALPTQANVQQVLQVLNGLPTNATVAQVQQVLNTLATAASVEQVKQRLTDLAAAVSDIQTTLVSPASSKLDLQVVELSEADSAHTRRWLLRTSINGAPAAALLEKVIAISTDKKKPPTLTDVTTMAVVTPLMPGLISVVVDVSKPNLADLAFHFSVSHAEGTGVMQAGILIGDTKK